MNFEDILRKKEISIGDLQQFQEEYDRRFVDEKFIGFEKIRHTTLHVAKLLGKLANYCEKKEEGVDQPPQQMIDEIIPDLIVYSLWLSREFNIKPHKVYFKRIINNIERMYKNKSSEKEIINLNRLINHFQ